MYINLCLMHNLPGATDFNHVTSAGLAMISQNLVCCLTTLSALINIQSVNIFEIFPRKMR
jgi:hypothetical protein